MRNPEKKSKFPAAHSNKTNHVGETFCCYLREKKFKNMKGCDACLSEYQHLKIDWQWPDVESVMGLIGFFFFFFCL